MPVALDAFGADGGPELVLEGARLAAADGIAVRLFGPPEQLTDLPTGVEMIASEEWISNDEDPVAAVRGKPGASVVMASADAADGNSGAVVSAGSTGATMTAALFALKRIHGVHRPALAVQIPQPSRDDGRPLLLLDVGANVEVRPQHLIQFAYIGAAFAEAVLGVEKPRVALLTIGEESRKGTPDVAEAHETLSGAAGIYFVGNAEGSDVFSDRADVIVTDGFTGNVALKTLEGTATAVAGGVRRAARSNPIAALGGLLLRPALGGLRRDMDPDATGGAILLGLRGVAVVAHGGTGAEGIANAVRLADRSIRENAVERTAERLAESGATRAALSGASSASRPGAPSADLPT